MKKKYLPCSEFRTIRGGSPAGTLHFPSCGEQFGVPEPLPAAKMMNYQLQGIACGDGIHKDVLVTISTQLVEIHGLNADSECERRSWE